MGNRCVTREDLIHKKMMVTVLEIFFAALDEMGVCEGCQLAAKAT